MKSEMYVLLLFMEEGQTVGNLCIWKACNKFIGNQYMESGGAGGGSRWARRGRRKRNMEDKVEFSIRKIAQSKLSTETILQRI